MQNKTIAYVYEKHLGGVMAISPELYGKVLDVMALELGRINDDQFQKEVYDYSKTLPCDLDW